MPRNNLQIGSQFLGKSETKPFKIIVTGKK